MVILGYFGYLWSILGGRPRGRSRLAWRADPTTSRLEHRAELQT